MQGERNKKSWREIDRGRDGSAHRRSGRASEQRRDETARANAEAKQHRSALEALFSPKVVVEDKPAALPKNAARIVLPPIPDADPKHAERRKLLAKLLTAKGPASISKAADAFMAAGFIFPDDQETHVQLLEHVDEERVREAIAKLTTIFAGELPKRRPVIEQRLRRIEDQADEADTRDMAAALRRMLHGRGVGPTSSNRI